MATPSFNFLAFLLARNAAQQLPGERQNLYGLMAGVTAGPALNVTRVLVPVALAGKEVAETQRDTAQNALQTVRASTLSSDEIQKALSTVTPTAFNLQSVTDALNSAIKAKQPPGTTGLGTATNEVVITGPPGSTVTVTLPPSTVGGTGQVSLPAAQGPSADTGQPQATDQAADRDTSRRTRS